MTKTKPRKVVGYCVPIPLECAKTSTTSIKLEDSNWVLFQALCGYEDMGLAIDANVLNIGVSLWNVRQFDLGTLPW